MSVYKKTLVIVESPAKAKIIGEYLNSTPELVSRYGRFSVVSSFGHIRDLKSKELSVEIENQFQPIYEVNPDKVKLVAELGKKIKEHDMILLASDLDLEGEAISWHIKEQFKIPTKKYKRITFNEITKTALKNAVLKAGKINENMVDAQQSRRVLDRLVGYKLSPLLWKYYKTNSGVLSAGRVQSAIIKIIMDREHEINKFKTMNYWSFEGTFSNDINEAKLYGKDNTIHKETDYKKIKTFLERFTKVFSVSKCVNKTKRVKPDQPFITSTLQQEAYSKIGSSIKRTMALAQGLYEHGYITYMRTDSYNMSQDAIDKLKNVVINKYGKTYYEEHVVGKKGAHSQEAHECIRPTNFSLEVIEENKDITKDHVKLYEMIWKRAIASRMKPSIWEEVDVVLVNDYLQKNNMYFLGKFKRLDFEGYLIVYGQKRESKSLNDKLKQIQNTKVACKEVFARNTWMSPPARYNESSIIKVLDTEGIGRPSTFASLLSKLYEKHYIEKLDIIGEKKESIHFIYNLGGKGTIKEKKEEVFVGKESSKLVPSDIGKSINEFLVNNFQYIVDKQFTANMEGELDKVAEGKYKYLEAMNSFWKEFSYHLDKFDNIKIKNADKIELKSESKVVNYDGKEYTIRITRFGPVAQTKNNSGKLEYKDLKTYLKMKGKDYRDIDENDMEFLMKIPYDYKNGYELKSGPYGLYIRYKDQNYKLQKKFINKDNLDALFKLSIIQLKQISSYVKKSKP